jgi:hypothetical protein
MNNGGSRISSGSNNSNAGQGSVSSLLSQEPAVGSSGSGGNGGGGGGGNGGFPLSLYVQRATTLAHAEERLACAAALEVKKKKNILT